ncbi:exosortase/archaeosortase family protein [Desulfobacterium sp. N47]|uniref:Eight transmembrane protein EpsH n=1 Tax=uncultured Desulfobacterium sp. TaxID=201089 RepID=E1YK48_9BACT|nr:hypothetical protein N47_E51640 [uncultured Desulfobacterium sp.]
MILISLVRSHLIKAGIYVLALILAYYSVLEKLVFIDWARADYSHCYLIPFVVIYLIWEKRDALLAIPSKTSWVGILPFSLGLIFFWIGELGGELFSLYISMWFVLVGLIWLHLGWDKIKALAFPLFMILTMFPFPYFINNKILLNLKLISSQLGVKLLQLYGMSVYREGNIIDLGFTKLQVVDACSGLRFVFPIMVLSLLLAYWFKAHWWKKIILFLSSVPMAVFANSFRIAATGILYSMFGAKVAEGFFHGFSAWIIFMLTIPVLLLEMWLLRLIPPKYEGLKARNIRYKVQGSRNKVNEREEEIVDCNSQLMGKRSIFSPVFMTTVVILLLTFGVSHMVNFREKIPVKKIIQRISA